MKEIGLYIHIPFCKQKCFYCDFPSYACKENLMKDYIEALCKEINDKCRNLIVRSLFIGGGTPSYLDEESLKVLMDTVKKLNFKENAEKSIECNPGTINEKKLKIIKEGTINRLSFGLQTTDNVLLKKIGRIHTFEQFKENYYLARKEGFNNINIDMMFGLPDQTIDMWIYSLQEVIDLKPEHISSYSLIIEEGTAFYKLDSMDKLNVPDEDEERDMYREGKRILEANGYMQYEISNYAKENKECFHNKLYWQCEEYLGVGTSASSFMDEKRFSNINNINEYIKRINNNESVVADEYANLRKDDIEEFMFMGLRMNCGVSEDEFYRRFGATIDSIYKNVIDKNESLGLLIRNCGRIYLSEKGFELSNIVMSEMIL